MAPQVKAIAECRTHIRKKQEEPIAPNSKKLTLFTLNSASSPVKAVEISSSSYLFHLPLVIAITTIEPNL